MKKKYIVPEIELLRMELVDVVLASPTEASMPEQFATEGDDLDLDL